MESQTTNGKRKAQKEKGEKPAKKFQKNENTEGQPEKPKFRSNPAKKGPFKGGEKPFGEKKSFSKQGNKFQEKFAKKNKANAGGDTNEEAYSERKGNEEGDSFFRYLNKLTHDLWKKKDSKKPKDQTVKEILGKVMPVLGKVINKRNGSKTVQACLKYGSDAQVKNIVNELTKGQYFEDMIKSKYGHYLAMRAIKKSDKAQREKIYHMIKSNIVFFVAHKEASRVVDCYIRNAASPKHLNDFKKLFNTANKEGVKKTEKIENIAMKIIENQSFNFIMSQHILYLALPELVPAERNKAFEVLKSKLIQISEKREGVLLAFRIINYSLNKERKVILKEFKDKIMLITKEGSLKYLLILKLLNSIDDTILLNKIITKEIADNIKEFMGLQNGSAILYGLFNPKKSVLASYESEVDFTTSKKNEDLRRKELLDQLSLAMFTFFLDEDVPTLLKSSFHSKNLSFFLSFIIAEEKTEYYQLPEKIWNALVADFNKGAKLKMNPTEANEKLLINHPDANKLFKNLIISVSTQISNKGNEALLADQFESFLVLILQNISIFLNTKAIFLVLTYIEHTSFREKIVDVIKKEPQLPEDTAPGMKALRELL